MSEIPQTTAVCDETGEEFSLLNPHLEVSVRVVKQVVQVDPLHQPSDDDEADPDDMEGSDPEIYLATKAGRGVLKRFKDWPAFHAWVEARKGYTSKLQFHHEDETPYAGSDGVGEEVEIATDEDGE